MHQCQDGWFFCSRYLPFIELYGKYPIKMIYGERERNNIRSQWDQNKSYYFTLLQSVIHNICFITLTILLYIILKQITTKELYFLCCKIQFTLKNVFPSILKDLDYFLKKKKKKNCYEKKICFIYFSLVVLINMQVTPFIYLVKKSQMNFNIAQII